MKKFFLTAAISAALFASCDKNDSDSITKPVEGSVVNLSFADSNITRAFFDESEASEKWEEELSKITVFAFKSSDGELIVRRDLNKDEREEKESTFALPGTSPNDNVDIVIVANYNINQDVVTYDAISKVLDNTVSEHNGAFSDIYNNSKRDDGFVMTSYNAVAVSEGTTKITAVLERTVSKVAMQLSVSDKFKGIYPGDVRIDDVTVSNTPSTTVLHSSFQTDDDDDEVNQERGYSSTQLSNKSEENYQNLFYIYESPTPEDIEDRVNLTINATYDMDGNFETSNDQTPITYNLTIEDDENISKIDRNSYYRINGSIDGLSGSDASLTISVANWATVTDKNIGLGQ